MISVTKYRKAQLQNIMSHCSIVLMTSATVVAEIFSQKTDGLMLLIIAGLSLLILDEFARKTLTVAYAAILLLLLTPITTDTTKPLAGLVLFACLSIAIIVPYALDSLFKTNILKFRNRKLPKIYRNRAILFVGLLSLAVYVFLPGYLESTGSYRNWTLEANLNSYLYLFIGALFVGTWDELFFVNTILPSFAKKMPFYIANMFSSIIFVSFLWSIGFRSWGPLVLYQFAYTQGYVYYKTGSLKLIISTHLVLDIILIFALIHSHFPSRMDIFIF